LVVRTPGQYSDTRLLGTGEIASLVRVSIKLVMVLVIVRDGESARSGSGLFGEGKSFTALTGDWWA
jgi:hypothetical protein